MKRREPISSLAVLEVFGAPLHEVSSHSAPPKKSLLVFPSEHVEWSFNDRTFICSFHLLVFFPPHLIPSHLTSSLLIPSSLSPSFQDSFQSLSRWPLASTVLQPPLLLIILSIPNRLMLPPLLISTVATDSRMSMGMVDVDCPD